MLAAGGSAMSGCRTRLCLAVLLTFAITPIAARAQFAPPALDHFTVYDAAGQLDPPFATFQDQLGIQAANLGTTRLFMVPARKNAEPVFDLQSHLTCYLLDGTPPPGVPKVTAVHQFGTQELNLGPARYACIPTEKFPPQQISIDHFVCYAATGAPATAGATFVDQFYGATHNLLDPFLFCAPAKKTLQSGIEELIDDPLSHLVCFHIEPQGPPPQIPTPDGRAPIRNQFGQDQLALGPRNAVCLPAMKEVPPPGALDHFLYYDATGPDGPPVTVVDQFGPQPAGLDLGPVVSFLVPADKNAEGLVDPFSHLTGYLAPGPQSPVGLVRVTNQFGVRNLELGPVRELLVPTRKLIGAQGPITIDHFLCYDAHGTPINKTVSVRDQFHPVAVSRLVREPFLFCNPADKNGEGIINVDDHLACYRLVPPGSPIGTVPIFNQFNPPGLPDLPIQVQADVALCVPSEKEINSIEVPGMPVWGIGALTLALVGIPTLLARRLRQAAQGS
jgi:hypothetical protein